MPNCSSININIELMAIAVLVAILASALLRRREGSTSTLLSVTVACLLAATLGDTAAWVFADSYLPGALVATTVGNAVCYLFGAVAYTLYAALVFREVGNVGAPRKTAGRAVMLVVLGLGVANLTLLVANASTGVLYTLDSSNTFTWGPWRLLPDDILLAQLMLVLAAVAVERGRSLTDTLAGYSLLGIVPIAAVLMEHAFPSLMLLYPSLAITILPVHIWEQHTHEMWMSERERELALARSETLAEQIKPHFISNTLLAIQQLMAEDPALARKVTQQFSLYLRDNYEAAERGGLASFSAELDHVRRYMSIEQADPASRVRLECDIGPADFEIPALSLQPLVENAVRHGLGPRPGGGTVRVSTADGGDAWLVEVSDDGVGFPEGAADGVGLGNVRERLRLLCDGSLTVEGGAWGTRATMRVPKVAPKGGGAR